MKTWILAVCFCLIAFGLQTSQAQEIGSSNRDRLRGQVRRVKVESAKVLVKEGKTVEAPRVVREITTYGTNGEKIDYVAYPSQDGTVAGKQQYKYDDKGNILEMTLRGKDGSILSREKYNYEFDEFGNWKKMTSFVAVYENGDIGYEPIEITYRTITYYFGQGIAKLANASAPTTLSNVTGVSSDVSPTIPNVENLNKGSRFEADPKVGEISGPTGFSINPTTEQSTTMEPRGNVTAPEKATIVKSTGSKHTRAAVTEAQEAYTPPLDSPERRAIIGALRAIVARELKKPLIFKISRLKVKDGRAEVTATPLQKNLQRFDYSNTPYEKCMIAGDCHDSLTAVLQKGKVAWTVVEYVFGSKDVSAAHD